MSEYLFPLSRLDRSALTSTVRPDLIDLSVLAYGYIHKYLSTRDAVAFELERAVAGETLSPDEERVAYALADDDETVEEALRRAADQSISVDPRELWMYVAAFDLRQRWTNTVHPWDQLTDAIEVFGQPNAYAELGQHVFRGLFSKVPTERDRVRRLDELLAADERRFGIPSEGPGARIELRGEET